MAHLPTISQNSKVKSQNMSYGHAIAIAALPTEPLPSDQLPLDPLRKHDSKFTLPASVIIGNQIL